MKLLFFTLLTLPAFFSVKASTIEIGWGADQKFHSLTDRFKKVICSDKEGYYVLKTKNNDYILERYSNANQLEGSKELILKNAQKKECEFLDVISANGKAVLFMSGSDKSTKLHTLYMQTFDKTLNGSVPEEVSRFEVTDFKKDWGTFFVSISDDQTKIIIGNKKYDSKNITFKLFDGSLKLLSEENIEVHPKLFIKQHKVDNEGRLIIFDGYDVLIYNPAADKLLEAHLAFTDKVSIQQSTGQEILFIQDQEDDKIYVGGYYHNKKEPFSNGGLNVEGIIYARIDKETGTVEKESVIPFTKEFLAQIDKRYTKAGGFNGLYLNSILVNENGSLTILGEQKYTEVSSGKFVYYNMYIVATNISETGEVNWNARIPKLQISEYGKEVHASFMTIEHDNGLMLLYYDNAKNFTQNNDNVSSSYMSGTSDIVLVSAIIGSEGQVSKEVILSPNKKECHYLIDTALNYKLEDGKFLIHASDFSDSVTKFGILTIK